MTFDTYIIKIEDFLFKGCWGLEKVFLSDKIEEIGVSAFEHCHRLKNPWLPKDLKVIRDRAFYGCNAITTIYIPEKVTEIGEDVFGECSNLVIKGVKGSIAELYALSKGITFIPD